jgi:hypothetical protein
MQFMADFAACDVLALTSDTECFALVQVEVMLCGTIVMTDTPGGRAGELSGMGRLRRSACWSIGETIVEVLDRRKSILTTTEIEHIFSFKETVDRYEDIFRAPCADYPARFPFCI